MKYIKNWFRSLFGLLFLLIIMIPSFMIWIVLLIITLGEIKIMNPSDDSSWFIRILEKIVGEDHWLIS